MVMRYFLMGCFLLGAAGRPGSSALAQEPRGALVTFQPSAVPTSPSPYAGRSGVEVGACREFLVDADGSVVLFAADVSRWQSGKWGPSSSIHPVGVVYDAAQGPDGKWFIGSQDQQQAVLYQYAGSSLARIGTAVGRFQGGMTLHPASDGTIWITTRGPTAYGIKDGKTTTRELVPGVSRDTYNLPFPPTVSFDVPGRGLWLWSHADYRAGRATEVLALKGFQVYEGAQWRAVSHSAGLLGGATLLDPNTLLGAGRYQGLFSLSIADGSVRDVNWALPGKDCCVFLHSTPSHRVLAITAEPVMPSQLPRNEDGAFGRLAVFENGAARILLEGIDCGEGRFDKGRPVVDTPLGTFIAAVGRGLVFVPSDASGARRFDWRSDIPVANIDRMRVQGSLLYLLDRTRGFAVVDWRRLLAQREAPSADRWSVHLAAQEPAVSPQGVIWWLDAGGLPGQLCEWEKGKLTRVPLDGSGLTAQSIQFIAADTKGGIWLVPKNANQPAAGFNSGKWRVFSGPEAAWSTIAAEEKDNPSFGFLPGRSHSIPSFGGRGLVVYAAPEARRLRYFDGTTWQSITSFPRSGFVEDRPFFVDGIVAAQFREGIQQFRGGQWKLVEGAPASARWPSGVISPPESFPGNRSRCTISLRDNADTTWMGTPEALYRGVEDLWVRFPTAGTPLVAAERLSNVLIDGAGDLWFVLQDGALIQLAHYTCPGTAPTLAWARPPASAVSTAQVTLACRVQGLSGRGLLRYRSDGGAWRQVPLDSEQQDISIENLPNGSHRIEVRAFDELLRSSPLLTCTIEVTRDYATEVDRLVTLLGSSDFKQREAAARTLVSIGRPAIPALTAQKDKATPDQQWWIQAVLDEIGR